MGSLRLVSSSKWLVSFAKEPYKRDDILQKRPMTLRHDDCDMTHYTSLVTLDWHIVMGWLRLVGSLKWLVSLAKEPYKRDDILQKRPMTLRRDDCDMTHYTSLVTLDWHIVMGWLRLVSSLKWLVSFAKEPYKRDDVLQKRPIILKSLLIIATPYAFPEHIWGLLSESIRLILEYVVWVSLCCNLMKCKWASFRKYVSHFPGIVGLFSNESQLKGTFHLASHTFVCDAKWRLSWLLKTPP